MVSLVSSVAIESFACRVINPRFSDDAGQSSALPSDDDDAVANDDDDDEHEEDDDTGDSGTGQGDTGDDDDATTGDTSKDLPPCAWRKRIRLGWSMPLTESVLADVPLMIALDPSRIDYGSTAELAADLRVTNADVSQRFAHEIDAWQVDGRSVLWFRLPSTDTNLAGDHVWLYYGNPVAQTEADAAAVWDEYYIGVWHLEDSLADSTAAERHGMGYGPVSAPGVLGQALSFDAVDDYATVEDVALDEFTFQAWIYAVNPNSYGTLVGYDAEHDIQLRGPDADSSAWRLTWYDGYNRYAESPVVPETWTLVTVVRSGRDITFYQQGLFDGTVDSTAGIVIDRFGGSSRPYEYYGGLMDEIRASSIARSADWVALQHRSMTDAVFEYGAPQDVVDACAVLEE